MRRTKAIINTMNAAGFGNCTNHYECEAACPKEISRKTMSLMYRDYVKSALAWQEQESKGEGGA
jgi:succinate dehydrogenase / fumarate reductase iron-sulfur subunit